MRPISFDRDSYDGVYVPGGYQELIDSMEHTTVLTETQGDYQGSSLVLLRDGQNQYGILRFGWGSCSGCDALQACSTEKELIELRDRLASQVVWYKDWTTMMNYLATKDTVTEWDGLLWDNFITLCQQNFCRHSKVKFAEDKTQVHCSECGKRWTP